jgi:hypothetical protein
LVKKTTVNWNQIGVFGLLMFLRITLVPMHISNCVDYRKEKWQHLKTVAVKSHLCVVWKYVLVRVTRLGEFLPIGWLFSLGSFCENYRSSRIIGLVFLREKLCCIFSQKMDWATFCLLFQNASGHPDVGLKWPFVGDRRSTTWWVQVERLLLFQIGPIFHEEFLCESTLPTNVQSWTRNSHWILSILITDV